MQTHIFDSNAEAFLFVWQPLMILTCTHLFDLNVEALCVTLNITYMMCIYQFVALS